MSKKLNADEVWQVISFALRHVEELEGSTKIGRILSQVNQKMEALDASDSANHRQELMNLLRLED